MKRSIILVLVFLTALSFQFSMSSCNRKVGCPSADAAQVRTNRKGDLSNKRGGSNLFPKDMRRKMK